MTVYTTPIDLILGVLRRSMFTIPPIAVIPVFIPPIAVIPVFLRSTGTCASAEKLSQSSPMCQDVAGHEWSHQHVFPQRSVPGALRVMSN